MTNTKSTKRALLSSVLALFLCFAMLLGTTYAWFTDSVTSGSNIIQSGTLDVDLVDEQGNSMEGQIIEFVAKDGRAQDAILWEPGCTYETEPVYVVNKGNLDLKYNILVNGIVGDAKLLEVIEWTVTIDGVEIDMYTYENKLLAGEKSGAIVLTGHMKETAGNEYMNLTASGISISVFATQLNSEYDSNNNTYDTSATYLNQDANGNYLISNANELVYFAKSVNVDGETYAGKTVKLIADIDLANRNWLPIGMIGHEMGSTYPWYYAPFCGTFDGNGYTISNMKTCDMWNVGNYQYFNGAALFGCTSDGAVIKNLTIKNAIVLGTAGNGGAGYAYASAVVGNHWKGSLTFENVSVEDSGIYGSAHIGCLLGIAGREKSNPATITFTNCTMKNITEVYVNKTHNNGDVIGTDGHFNPTIIGEDSVVQNNVTVKQDRDEFYRIKAEYFPDLT